MTVFSEIADGAPVACTSEVYLIRGVDASLNESLEMINGMFADYAQLSLKPEYTVEKINELREAVKNNSSYESTLKPMLDRAEAILNGAIRKDIYREFSTDPNAKNTIVRMGDLRGYCANTLKHSSFGTNRQVTGIAANTGEKLTIYVEANENDPLPKIVCTQIYGAWNSWKAEYQLHVGKNEIIFPNLKARGNYSRSIAPGGPIHIVNPYEENQQSTNVKIYIEGGALYPVFRDGDDEATFKMILENYYSRLTDPNDTGVTVDCFEAVTGNVMLSCTASIAYASYIRGGSSPQYNIDKWRRYITGLLRFGGVELDPQGQYYNVKNEYIKVNIRAVQPYAGMYAFAAADHVGIIDSATFGAMVQMWTTGWAFAHEVGHMLDNMNMKRPEITNNMWAIYDIYMQNGAFNDRINVTNVSKNLSSDFAAKVGNYWANGNSNCDFWWIIEGGHPGYWAKLQQLYCFDSRGNDLKDATERLAYYSSIATGEDMTEYFSRWGFYLTGETRFDSTKVSATYKSKMEEAKNKGWVTGDGKKYWYVNNEQYRQEKAHGGKLDPSWASCYDSSQVITAQITMAGNSYSIKLPEPVDATAHLCYEIQGYIDGAWKVLGVTYGTMFNDSYAYQEGVTPKYKIYAYDRMLNHTGEPMEQSPMEEERQFEVCRIGDVKYDSLKAAIEAVADGDTIYLLKDCSDGGIKVTDKSFTIAVDPSVEKDSITIKKNAEGVLIHVMSSSKRGVVVKINEQDSSKKIILDGGEFWQNGSLLRVHGAGYNGVQVWAYNTVLCNNWNNENGGAAYLGYIGQFYFVNCEIKNNRAKNGAGAYLEGSNPGYSKTQFALFNVLFENNIASANGGAIYSSSVNGKVFTVNSTSNNDPAYSQVILRGNKAVHGGGIYADNIIDLKYLTLENNTATGKGGGIYFARVENSLNMVTVRDNTSGDGKSNAFYLGGTTLTVAGGNISGSIEKSDKAKFNISTAMPNFSNAIFYLPTIAAEGTILVDAVSDFTPTEEEIETIQIANATAKIQEKTIQAIQKIAEVTIHGGEEPLIVQQPFGTWVLPEHVKGLSENCYIESWTINNKTYKTGEKVEITGNISVSAEVKEYYTITLEYGNNSKELKVQQNYVYYLPMKTPDEDVVFGWTLNIDNKDYPYAWGLEITSDVTLKAIVKAKFTVTTDILGEITSSQHDYGSSYVLLTPPLVLGKAFSHWEVNGDKYLPNSTLTVEGNLNIKACYTATWNVIRIIEDEESTKNYADGTVITLDNPGESLGRKFVYWSINGVKYYAGANYTISCDTEMQAVFMSPYRLPSDMTLTVTLIYNRGAISTEGEESEIQENETETVDVAFNSNYTFKTIDVHEGYVFLYWEVNGAKYYPGDSIIVTSSFTANASVVEKSLTEPEEGQVKVTLEMYKEGEITTTNYYSAVGDVIFLGNVEAPAGKKFSYWEVNGEKIIDISFIVEDETIVKAIYEDSGNTNQPGENTGNTVENTGNNTGGEPSGGEEIKNGNGNMGLVIGLVAGILLVGVGITVLFIIIRKKRK